MRTLLVTLALAVATQAAGIDGKVKDGYADSNGVKIHYASVGSGPLIVMIHGFPDFWYTWRDQMAALSDQYQCVAIDQRGYNLSDKPKGVENYQMKFLVGDVAAVIKSLGRDKAIDRRTRLGRDGGVAVRDGFSADDRQTDHFESSASARPVARAGAQSSAAEEQPVRAQLPAAGRRVESNGRRVGGADSKIPELHAKYLEAFKRSDIEAMLNYYKANYPREPYTEDTSPVVKVQAPVLEFHGLSDGALLAGALNNTWEWLAKDFTLVTIPGAGHWVQQDASDLVSKTMKAWLSIH